MGEIRIPCCALAKYENVEDGGLIRKTLRFPHLMSIPGFSVDLLISRYLPARSNDMATTNINSLFGVAGRVALVTGGGSGIGLMIAKVSSIALYSS